MSNLTIRRTLQSTVSYTVNPTFHEFDRFTPADLTGVKQDFDYTDLNKLVQSAGSVSRVDNLVSSEITYQSQASSGRQPFIDVNAPEEGVLWTEDFLVSDAPLEGGSDFTVFMVLDYSGATATSQAFYGLNGTDGGFWGERLRADFDDRIDVLVGGFTNGVDAYRDGGNAWTVNPVIAVMQYSVDGGFVKTFQGTIETASGALTTTTNRPTETFQVGTLRQIVLDSFLNGVKLRRFTQCNAVSTPEEISKMVAFLKKKYGV